MLNSDTQAISIDEKPEKVFGFLTNPNNLPRWAVGFARAVREDHGRWFVTTNSGEIGLRIAADNGTGVIDFWMAPEPGIEFLAASRVIPNGPATEYTFTQFRATGMSEEAFTSSIQAVKHELTVLKALLEVECPL